MSSHLNIAFYPCILMESSHINRCISHLHQSAQWRSFREHYTFRQASLVFLYIDVYGYIVDISSFCIKQRLGTTWHPVSQVVWEILSYTPLRLYALLLGRFIEYIRISSKTLHVGEPLIELPFKMKSEIVYKGKSTLPFP